MVRGSLRAQLTRQFGCGMRRPVLQLASLCKVTLTGSAPSHSRQMVHGSLRVQATRQFGCGVQRPVPQSASLYTVTLHQSVKPLVFLADGTQIASCSYDGASRLQRTSINHGGTASNVNRDPTSLPATDMVSGMKQPPLFLSYLER